MAYLALIGAALASAHRTIRGEDAERAPPALAAAAGVMAFAIGSALFDAFAFPAVAYVFFLLAGMIVVAGLPGAKTSADRAEPPAASLEQR
jgi:hypothetical protein